MAYYVEVREYDDDSDDDILVRRMGPMTASKAEKIERGLDQRIDTERFYSRVVESTV